MKRILGLLLLTGTSAAWAQTPVVIYQPAPVPTVVSPLTNSVSASNQQLLGQVSGTLSQRRFDHDISVARQQALTARPVYPVYRVKGK